MEKQFPAVKKNEKGCQIVSGRELHECLEIGRDFTTWIKERIEKYQFEENVDFTVVSIAPQNGGAKRGGQNKIDYIILLDMAKEISMIENNEQGRKARKYFIECERKLFNVLEGQLKLINKVETDKNFDWAIKRVRDTIDQAEHIEDQIAFLFDKLKEIYTKAGLLIEVKTKQTSESFYQFKTPEKYDASQEQLPFVMFESRKS